MIINSLEVSNFRNYENQKIIFNKNKNILYGKNAQGKTSILEAVYMCSTSKSHRTSKDGEIVKIGKTESHINAIIKKDESEYEIDIHLNEGKTKAIYINKRLIRKAIDLFGYLNVVLFSPEDLDIVKRGPEVRRKYLDTEICQIDKVYLNDLIVYKKALNQRNRLLKDINYNSTLKDMLFAWDEKLVYHGSRIISKRKEYIEEIKPIFFEKYKNLSSGENIDIFYEPNVDGECFKKELEKSLSKDIKFGNTGVGPHRDDLGFCINDLDIRKYGSQGQQRSAALSLKLSEIEIIKEKTRENPVLLLDDVLSELDSTRQEQLIENLEDVQTILTCTGIDDILEKNFKSCKVFMVDNANITVVRETED